MKMKVIIIGGGQVGAYIASLLISNGHEIKVIENRENIYNKLEKELPKEVLIFGNGSDPAVLEEAGIASANVVAAVTGADEVNLVVSTLAKMEFDVARVVACVNNPKNAWLYNSGMGVDVGVNQADIVAHFVVEEMNLKDMFTILKLNREDYSIIQVKVQPNAKAVNQFVKNLSIPKGTLLIAIMRGESLTIPKGDTQILAGDEILALTHAASNKILEEIFD
jgi:trk system potassium uptake protein TrkA